MTVAWNKFNILPQNLSQGVHNLATDTTKIMLTNTAPVATNALKADITEIAAGNGYTAGGNACSVTSDTQSGGVLKYILANPATWTASGGTIGPFRYAVHYDDTPSSPLKPLIGWYDYGSAITLGIDEQFQVALDATNGTFTIS